MPSANCLHRGRKQFLRAISLATQLAMFAIAALAGLPMQAQDKGKPGEFDFYLMNVAWGPEFCTVPGAGPHCTPPRGFVLHGLWTQNNNGTYPVFCSSEPGLPTDDLAKNLDITPDLPLLQHEWDKHGTCAAVGPRRFFRMEHEAFHSLKIPARFAGIDTQTDQSTSFATADVLHDFYNANPKFPEGSILLSCAHSRLTAVEACFSKDLKPMRCRGLQSCAEPVLNLVPSTAAGSSPTGMRKGGGGQK